MLKSVWSMYSFSGVCIPSLRNVYTLWSIYTYLLRSVYTDCIQIAITPQSGGSSTLTPQSEGNSAVRSLCRVESNRHTLQRVDGTMYALCGAHAKWKHSTDFIQLTNTLQSKGNHVHTLHLLYGLYAYVSTPHSVERELCTYSADCILPANTPWSGGTCTQSAEYLQNSNSLRTLYNLQTLCRVEGTLH